MSQDDATLLYIDAPIKNIVISLIQNQTSVQEITVHPLWKYGTTAYIYNLQGKLLKQFIIDANSTNILHAYFEPIIIVLQNKNKSDSCFYYITSHF
jgi:hypothetical protein